MTVNFGTDAPGLDHDELRAVLADAGALRIRWPTMKPVMFWRKTRGVRFLSQSSMKWAPLSDESLKRTPLLARMPTFWPQIQA